MRPHFRMRGRGIRRKPGEMNGLERQWSEALELARQRGEILWWKHEAITLKLAPDTRYTPDFSVMLADGTIRLDECKGFMEDDAWVKLKVAAEMFPFAFRLVRRRAKKDGGGWEIKDLNVDDSSPGGKPALFAEPA